jgi:excisionase family DNA binding protein
VLSLAPAGVRGLSLAFTGLGWRSLASKPRLLNTVIPSTALPVLKLPAIAATRGTRAQQKGDGMKDEYDNTTPHELPIDSKTAAAYLNIHYKTVELMARMGEIPATKYGQSWQFLRSMLSDWLRERMRSNVKKSQAKDRPKEERIQ